MFSLVKISQNKMRILKIELAVCTLLLSFFCIYAATAAPVIILGLVFIIVIPVMICFLILIDKPIREDALNFKNFLAIHKNLNKYGIALFIVVNILFIYILAVYPMTDSTMMNMVVTNNENSGSFNALANSIFKDKPDNVSKVLAILEWQNNSMIDEYGDYKGYDKYYIMNTGLYIPYPAHILVFGNIFYTPPSNICLRVVPGVDPNWTLLSGGGACAELSQAFSQMATLGGIPVRTVNLVGADHQLDEVYINGSWITIDPSIVIDTRNATSGFNVSPRMYEMPLDEGWAKNIQFAIATYPNGTSEDITYRYTNTSNLQIKVLDKLNNTIANAKITVPGNSAQFNTDANGSCTIQLKPGRYTINADNGSSTGSIDVQINQSSNSTVTMLLNNEKPVSTITNTIYQDTLVNFIQFFILGITAVIFTYIIFLFSLILIEEIKIIRHVDEYKMEAPIEVKN
jgi:hypothetical protein